jgi:hypothetical protein
MKSRRVPGPHYGEAFARNGSPDNNDEVLLVEAGFSIQHPSEHQWLITGQNLRLNHWPARQRWRVFGKSFTANPRAVPKAIQAGRIRLPESAQQAKCKFCQCSIHWLRAENGGWLAPIQDDGDMHAPRCSGQQR